MLSRRPGPGGVAADLGTGAGVDAALSGVDTVINCVTTRGRDAPATATLLDAAERAGVRHLVHVSIVGIDRVPLGYYQEKGQRDFRLLDPSGCYVRLTSSG